jgi:peptidoglycan-associated lipoprotein
MVPKIFVRLMLPATAALVAVLGAGCASKGFVREYVEQQVAPQREATARLQTDLTAVKLTADSADSRSSRAETMARGAFDEAAAARRLASKIASGDLTYNVIQTSEINFGFDKFSLSNNARSELDHVASMLEQHPQYILEIVGGTDQVGSQRYNLRLGQERAETVRRYLNSEHHVPLSKMATISFGSGKPVAQGEGKAMEARNRRAEIRVLQVQDVDLVGLTTTPGN